MAMIKVAFIQKGSVEMKKLYLIALFGFFFWGLVSDIRGVMGLTDETEILTVFEIIDYVFIFIALIGYSAYVYGRKLTPVGFWKGFTIIFIAWTVAMSIYNFYLQTRLVWNFIDVVAIEAIVKLVFLAIMYPLFRGLYKFSFRR